MRPAAAGLEPVSQILARVWPDLATPRDLRLERTWREPKPQPARVDLVAPVPARKRSA